MFYSCINTFSLFFLLIFSFEVDDFLAPAWIPMILMCINILNIVDTQNVKSWLTNIRNHHGTTMERTNSCCWSQIVGLRHGGSGCCWIRVSKRPQFWKGLLLTSFGYKIWTDYPSSRSAVIYGQICQHYS